MFVGPLASLAADGDWEQQKRRRFNSLQNPIQLRGLFYPSARFAPAA